VTPPPARAQPPFARMLAAAAVHLRPFHWREAMLCARALPLLLYFGLANGQPLRGAIAAGAAFSVGFGAVRELGRRRWGAMAAITHRPRAPALVQGDRIGE
jgi:hypothetical protein